MSQATPQMRHFARRLIIFETKENKSSGIKIVAAFGVCEKLRPQLATMMGHGGFRALLARALSLAAAEVPWLRGVTIKADGALEGLDDLAAQDDPRELDRGNLILVAQLLGLLVAFVGENFTFRMAREVWPKLSLEDLDFGKGDKK